MSFFQHQDRARRRTRLLVVLFALAVISIIAVVDLIALLVVGLGQSTEGALVTPIQVGEHLPLLIWVSLLTAGAIGLASLLRILTLRGGGGTVARGLGGVLVGADTQDPQLQRLRNVVEEMAIASGVPVPAIYVLEHEEGINAFAAGYSPADAALAVTRGALQGLSRAELQGVVAHELSHILNGDMRLNIHLIGLLFGILVLAVIGRIMISARHSRSSKGSAGIVLIGLALMITGYIGLFFGRLIQASVSRQREFLADASAVQFTREPAGIAGALKKIALADSGSRLHANTEEIGHMLFAAGLKQRLLATHPPLVERIRAIEPGFDPGDLDVMRALRTMEPRERTPAMATTVAAGVSAMRGPLDAEHVIQGIGQPDPRRIQLAADLRASIPEPLARAARSTEWVIEVVCYLLVDPEPAIRDAQLMMVVETLGGERERQLGTLLATVPSLAPELRIPLLEIAFPTLRRRPTSELERLLDLVERLIHADGRVAVFEYALARMLRQQVSDSLAPAATRHAGHARLHEREPEVRDLLVILALHGSPDPGRARAAFAAGLAALGIKPSEQTPIRARDWPERLDRALDRLDALRLVEKERLVRALLATIQRDGVRQTELELLRVIAAALHVPMPILTP